jgi:hypothetical protein
MAATATRVGIVYYVLLALGVTMAADVQNHLGIAIVPMILVGILCELRLRPLLASRSMDLAST